MGAAIALLGVLVLLLQGYRLIFARAPDTLHASDLLIVPDVAWLMRLCCFAARTGSTPKEFPSWGKHRRGIWWAV